MDDEPLCAKGQALLDAEDDRHDEAVAVLRRAVRAGEHGGPALLARALLDRGHRHATVELLAPRVAAGRRDLALLLADALASVGDEERAEEAYRVAVTGGDVAAMNTFGVFLRHRGRLREAERMLSRAAEAGDEMAPANLVALLWELTEPVAARRTAERWADEARPSTLLGLAFIHAARARYDEAERTYRRAAELGAYRGHIEYAVFLQRAREDVAGAEAELIEAERLQEPGWALAFGQFLGDVGRPDEARAYLEHAAYWGSLEAATALRDMDGEFDDD